MTQPVIIGNATLYLGDCLDILPTLEAGSVDAVVTDPPYGIGKAAWDAAFDHTWMPLVAPLTNRLVIMPGVWNILDCPKNIDGLVYKWTLSAHLVNGMTRGGMGFGNWIPALVYLRKVYRADVVEWCSTFADWCKANGVSRSDLNRATGTSDMGGWWASKLPHRCQVPCATEWKKIRAAFSPPDMFDGLVAKTEYSPIGDCKDFTIGSDTKPDHPCPKPLDVVRWLVDSIMRQNGGIVLDPFMGSGTTGVACAQTGRKFIGIEIDPGYFDIACKRIEAAQMQGRLL